MASALGTATTLIGHVKDDEGRIQTEPFLNIARLLLPIIDKLGVAFYPVKQDVNGNIERLANRARQDVTQFQFLYEIIKAELATGEHAKLDSCAKGLLWLKRAMEFVLALLQQLCDDDQKSLSEAANEGYAQTLQPFHGLLTYGVFLAAMKCVPSREKFFQNLEESDSNMKERMRIFLDSMVPLVQEVHEFLVQNNLNDPTRV